ncbi:MAG: Rab family GTPase [Pyrinomonadaceae bacterium]
MIQKKICMLGAYAVGKTSLVQRYVQSIYTDKYLTTVGVKIDKKPVQVGDTEVNLLLWDIQGDDGVEKLRSSYIRGASGYLLVIDGTRAATLDTAHDVQAFVDKEIGLIPFVVAINKADLIEEWQITPVQIEELIARGWLVQHTSAKSGQGVEQAFSTLAERIMEK